MQAESPDLISGDRLAPAGAAAGRHRGGLQHHRGESTGTPRTQQTGVSSFLDNRRDVLHLRGVRRGDLVGMIDEQALSKLREQGLDRHSARRAQFVQQQHGGTEPVERIAFSRCFLQAANSKVHLLFEQGKEKLMLAVEVLVETAQRLFRPIDDLLNGELRRLLLGDDLTGRVEKALHSLGRPLPSRLGGPVDGALTPCGFRGGLHRRCRRGGGGIRNSRHTATLR